jgi:Undecaprenyl-phosphate glucose phosphotransferase
MSKLLSDQLPRSSTRSVPPLSSTVASSMLIAADSIMILAAGYLTYDSIVVYSLQVNHYIATVVFVWLTAVSLLNFAGLYGFEAALRPWRKISYIIVAVAVAYLFLLAAAFSLKISENFSRVWVTAFAVSTTAALAAERLLLAWAFARLLRTEGFKRNLAVIGEGRQVERLVADVTGQFTMPVRVAGVYSSALDPQGSTDRPGLGALFEAARAGKVDDVAIALPWSRDQDIEYLVSRLRELPVNVYLVSDLAGFRLHFRAPPDHFGALPMVEVVGKPMSGWDAAIKSAEDYVLGLLILVSVAPVLAVIAALVKWDSPGPVFFRQKRLGFNNKVFDVYKFRTMYHGEVPEERVRQATAGDPRITPVGRILRRWSLDELPQILNVLNGTMSLVGPRPHALDHNEEFAHRMQSYFARHRVKPGITGLAQVKGFRGPTDTEEKLEGRVRNDLYYVENWSPSLDFKILLRTALICIRGTNAF